jgi:nicotinamidase-related amidase
MALTTLDPRTALIVIDLQKGIVGLPCVHPIERVIERAHLLVQTFRRHGLPVVLVNVTGVAPGRTEQPRSTAQRPPGWSELIPELDPQPADLLITKQTWGAFANTTLGATLRQQGVTQVVILGVATATGVESTARQAYEQGFNVTLAIDAMTDLRAEAHEYSVRHVFPRLGETGTCQDIVDLVTARGV